MHPPGTVQAAVELGAQGLNATEIARELDVPRGTVRDWLPGAAPRSLKPGACSRCGGKHDFSLLTESYVYLLGLYLGDGSISTHAREVYRLRIVLDTRYPGIITSTAAAMRAVRRGVVSVQKRKNQNCVDVQAYWKSWPCVLPQHGVGKKHERPIVLTDWQQLLVERWPHELLRGLIHSDGHRFLNTGRGGWVCPRYGFTQASEDIRWIFCRACDLVGVRWTRSGERVIYVSCKADVAILDGFIGPKR